MYDWFGDNKLSISAFKKAGFDLDTYTGISKEHDFICYEYKVQIIRTEFFKISKN